MADDKQAVVDESKAAAVPAATDDSARSDADPLETLLAEYDQSVRPAAPASPPASPPPPPDANLANEVQFLRSQVNEIANEKFRREITQVINEIRGDTPAEVFDDDLMEGWLNILAAKDPRLSQAFQQKDQNPRQWAKVKVELGKRWQEKVGRMPDRGATEDRHAVAQSMRGASTRVAAEPPPKFGSMSNSEYRKAIREQYGFDPGV